MKTEFSSSNISHIKDCILSLFWKKEDLHDFFSKSGCPSRLLPMKKDLREMKRFEIVDSVFNRLNATADKGTAIIRHMVFDLSEWDYFDPYYFEELKQLNRDIAETNIKKVKKINDAYNKKIKEAKENKKKVQHPKIASIQEIQNEYRGLFKKTDRNGKLITSQDRGYYLENLIMKIAKRENLQVTRPFKIKGEQIDGDLKFEGEHYLVEAKWHDKQTASNDLYQFAYKTEGKLYGRGLFISINGFSTESVEALTIGKAVRTILIDGTDFMHVVEGRISFSELLDYKIKAAQTAGLIYYDAVMQKSKIQ